MGELIHLPGAAKVPKLTTLGSLVNSKPKAARTIIRQACAHCDGAIEKMAVYLGVSYPSLYRWIRTLGLEDEITNFEKTHRVG